MTSSAANPSEAGPAARRIDRALRALRISGRRLVRHNGRWQVRADSQRWPVITLRREDVERLRADGRLAAAEGGGYILAAAAVEEMTAADPEETPRAGPWIYAPAGRRGRPHGFAGLALRAQNGEGPLTLRQASAGLKLIADAEQAGRDPTLTMNWDAGPVDKRRRDGRQPYRTGAARKADTRIRCARDALGEAFALAWSACIEQFPLSRLERRHRLPAHGAAAALAEALEKLAHVYDGSAPRARG
jgi:hypothetical protein